MDRSMCRMDPVDRGGAVALPCAGSLQDTGRPGVYRRNPADLLAHRRPGSRAQSSSVSSTRCAVGLLADFGPGMQVRDPRGLGV